MAGRGLSTCQCGEQARTFSCQGSLDSFNWEQSLRPQTRSTGETGSRTLRCFLCSRRTELGQVGATCAASSAGWADWACEAALTACTSSLEPFIWVSGRLPPTREDEGVAYWFLTENQFNCLGVFQRPIHSLDKYFSNASVCQVRAWGFRGAPLRTLFLPLSGKRECWYVRRDLLSGGGIKHRPSRRQHWTQGALPGGSASGARWHLTLGGRGKGHRWCISPDQYFCTPLPFWGNRAGEAGFVVGDSPPSIIPASCVPRSIPTPSSPPTWDGPHFTPWLAHLFMCTGGWEMKVPQKWKELRNRLLHWGQLVTPLVLKTWSQTSKACGGTPSPSPWKHSFFNFPGPCSPDSLAPMCNFWCILS